ncbi:MAG: ion transporter [Spirochaetales bacterium]|nr:ion transporter [Spirochaetales bacterium]
MVISLMRVKEIWAATATFIGKIKALNGPEFADTDSVKLFRAVRHLLIQILGHPAYNFLATLATAGSICLIFIPAFFDLSLEGSRRLLDLDHLLLLLFSVEAALKFIASGRRYLLRLPFFIDLAVIAPLFYYVLCQELYARGFILDVQAWQEFPGLDILKGARIFRFLYLFHFFYSLKQMGLFVEESRSAAKERIFGGIAAIQFSFVLLAGMASSWFYASLNETQRQTRIEQISQHATDYGLERTYAAYKEEVLYVRQAALEGSFEIKSLDPAYVSAHFLYKRDYIQIDGVTPGGTIQISFRDLVQNQRKIELLVLFIGAVVIVTLLFGLNYYLNQIVIHPVSRAMRVIELRMAGEELEHSLHEEQIPSEITALIHKVDLLYQQMREPAEFIEAVPQ